MNFKLFNRTTTETLEDHEGLLDKHTVDIEELKKKMEGATFGGEGPSLEEMDKRYAKKDEPDLTIVRIEELEAMSEMLLNRIIKQEKSLYHNSTLEQMKNNDKLKERISSAVKQDRDESAKRGSSANLHKGPSKDMTTELDKIMAEIDNLNDADMCLTTRVINLEKGLGAANKELKVHGEDI